MQVELGEHVRSHDHQEVGVIQRLILDPSSGQVKSVVIEKGLFLTDAIELPLSTLQKSGPDEIYLTLSAQELAQLPRFDESRYTHAPPEVMAPFSNAPVGSILWPVAYPPTLAMGSIYPAPALSPGLIPVLPVLPETDGEAPESEQEALRDRLDRENAVIAIGSDVISQEGEKVGEVHNVVFDAETGQPTALVVSKGWFFTEHLELPARVIASIDDGVITLTLTKQQLEAAPREPGTILF